MIPREQVSVITGVGTRENIARSSQTCQKCGDRGSRGLCSRFEVAVKVEDHGVDGGSVHDGKKTECA